MAVTLERGTFSINIQRIINSANQAITQTRAKESSRKEAEFQKAIANGMSYESQIKFREEQLSAEKNKGEFVDLDYITSLETSIGTLRKMARAEKIRNTYTNALNNYIAGKGSIDTYMQVISDALGSEMDPDIRKSLQSLQSDAIQKKAEIETSAIKNRMTFAEKDNSIPLVNQSIREITDKRARAAVNGNDDEVAMWDDALLSLNQSKAKISIENTYNDITYKVARNNPNIDTQLSYYQQAVSSAAKSGPVTYDGIQYASEAAFWEAQRGSFIANQYLPKKSQELDAETDRIAELSPNGVIPVVRIKAIQDAYDNMKAIPGMDVYATQIDQQKVAKISEIVNNIAGTIVDEQSKRLNELSDPFGADNAEFNTINNNAEKAILDLESRSGISVVRMPTKAETNAGKTVAENVLKAPRGTQPTTSSTAQELANYVSTNGISNLSSQDWWKNNPNKQEAWNLISNTTVTKEPTNQSSAQELANFVQKNGITDLKSKQWWSSNPNKQAAWAIINDAAGMPAAPAATPAAPAVSTPKPVVSTPEKVPTPATNTTPPKRSDFATIEEYQMAQANYRKTLKI